ncbi:MAG: sensor histidine kinase [Bacillota bacterium]
MKKLERFRTMPLWMRLAMYFLLLSAVILLLFQGIFNYSLDRHMEVYTREREEAINKQIVNSLREYYAINDSWDGIHMPLLHAALSTNTRLLLYDATGRLIGDTDQQGRRHMMMVPNQQPALSGVSTYQYVMGYNDTIVGKLVIAHPMTAETSALLEQDLYFRRAITGSLIWTGLIAISAALALGIIFSRRLSKPLEDIARGSLRITRGDYSLELPRYEGKEIDDLAGSFNRLASHLHELEKLRKRSVADIAHELRTPLTTLRGYIEAINDGVMPADPKTMKILLQEIMHLNRVASDLDELAHAEGTSSDQLSRESLNLGQFLFNKVSSFQLLYRKKDLTLQLNLPEQEVIIDQDPAALGKIISNLLDNAYRYSNPGGSIDVTLDNNPVVEPNTVAPLGQKTPAPGELQAKLSNMVLVKVTDNGIGISEENLPYIFERFYRADPSREKEQSKAGSGIGLALVKELVRSSGGLILVSSKLGDGTTFYLYFSRAE